MYKRIMLAVDGSDNSVRAAEHGAYIASMDKNCTVEIVLVADFAKAKSEVLHAGDPAVLQMKRRKLLEPFEQLFADQATSYHTHILHGDPAPTVVDFANKSNVDLVIVGSRGLNALQEMVLGSVSHKVVKRVNCPVLVVK
ncbi:universal stress protein [Paenibacillus yanchengensis]|uniref:Universal stress protein n=1 Tax=Paenibacillus yanchengensis TaxID=2035833 RepID=A0ABW4YEZ5_9BACL